MIGREAFDSPAHHLSDMTGMSLPQATILLSEHDGDANEAAEAYFLSQATASSSTPTPTPTPTPEPNATNAIDQLLENTSPMSESSSTNRATSFGRRLNDSRSSTVVPESILKRTVHVAFFKDCILFFEEPKLKVQKRRRGIQTYSSNTGPYHDRPDISSWVGSMIEIGRINSSDKRYQQVTKDMNSNKVPNLPLFQSKANNATAAVSNERVQFNLILHDLREKLPPSIVSSEKTSSFNFAGTGNSLGGGGNKSKRPSTPERNNLSIKKLTRDKSSIHIYGTWYVNQFQCDLLIILLGAIVFPLFFSYVLQWNNVNLYYSIFGIATTYIAIQYYKQSFQIVLKYTTVDATKPTTTLKFQFQNTRITWTQTFNHDHSIMDLYLGIVEKIFGKESGEYRNFFSETLKNSSGSGSGSGSGSDNTRSINDAEMFVKLLAGRDRRLLNCFDTNVSLKDEKLIQERVEVVVYWDLIEQEKEKVIGKMKVM